MKFSRHGKHWLMSDCKHYTVCRSGTSEYRYLAWFLPRGNADAAFPKPDAEPLEAFNTSQEAEDHCRRHEEQRKSNGS